MSSGSGSFRQRTVAGIGWSGFARIGTQGLQLGLGILLARLLSPEAFGLIAMIAVFTGFATLFIDMGFGAALIHKQDVTPQHYDAVFWLNVAMGAALTGFFSLVAPLVARFYREPILLPLTILLASNFLIGSLGIVHAVRLKKMLVFRRLAVIDLTAVVLSGVVGIGMALAGQGVWSLAIQSVLATTITAMLLWIKADWRPSLGVSKEAIADLWSFSANLLGFNALNYWFRHADDLLVGRFLGTAPLGIYSKAYGIMLLPLKTISHTLSQVLFPALSTIQADIPRVASIYLKMIRSVALVAFPFMLGLLAVADHFVLGLLGPQWADMIPVLRLFCLAGLVQSILTLNGSLYQSQGRTDLQFKVGGVVGVIGVVVIAVALPWGLQGVALAYTAYTLAVTYPSLRVATSTVGLTCMDVARNLGGVSICAVSMAAVIWLANPLFDGWTHSAILCAQVVLGTVVYGVCIHVFDLRAYRDLRPLVAEQWHRLRNSLSDSSAS